MKRLFLFLAIMIASQLLGATSCFADDLTDTVAVKASDVKDGMRLYIQSANPQYEGAVITAKNVSSAQCLMLNEALTSNNKDSALWTLVSTGQNDPIYTDKPTYYLYNANLQLYFGVNGEVTSTNSNFKRLVSTTDKAYAFCVLTKDEINTKENRNNMDNYGNANAVYFHHSNSDGSWFRLGRFNSEQVTYYSSDSYLKAYGNNQAMLIYTPDIPNSKKAAEGIKTLQDYVDEISANCKVMLSSTYDDVALDKTALKAALDDANNALTTLPSGENSYYTAIKDTLQAAYEKVPYVEGGRDRWLISADSVKAGKKVIFRFLHDYYNNSYIDKYMATNPAVTSGQNSVMVKGETKDDATVWELVDAKATDTIYSTPTYYLKDTSTGKYLGTMDSLTNKEQSHKCMVDDITKAYAFTILSAKYVSKIDSFTLKTYDNDDAVVIQHSNRADSWFRLARYGSNDYLYYFQKNDQFTAWSMYTAESDYSIKGELAQAINAYGSLKLPVGNNPGEYSEAAVSDYYNAVAQAKAVSGNESRAKIRGIIDNLKAQYEIANALEPNPVVTGYYYIVSAQKGTAIYDPKTDSNDPGNVKLQDFDANKKSQIFYVTETEDGSELFDIQNLATSRYIGAITKNSYVPYSDTLLTNKHHRFIYHTQGQFNWIVAGETSYFNPNGDNLNVTFRGGNASSNTDWYLKRVPDYIIENFKESAKYENNGGALVATGEITLAGLKSFVEANEGITSIDLSGATLPEEVIADDLEALMGDNVVVYLPESATIGGQNIVVGNSCSSLVLADKTAFVPAKTFTAEKVDIARQLYGGLNTVCLPFSFTASDIADATDVKLYVYSSTTDGSVVFDEATEVKAGQAALVYIGGDEDDARQYTISKENVEITVSPVDDDVIQGVFDTLKVGTGAYKLNQAGKAFVATTEASTVLPFRFYMKATKSGSAAYSLILRDEDDITGLADATSTDYSLKEISAVYDAAGHKLQSPKKGVNIFRYADGTTRKIYIK